MISIAINNVNEIIQFFESELDDHSSKAKASLEKYRGEITQVKQKKYVQLLIDKLPGIIKDESKHFETHCDNFNMIIPENEIVKKKYKYFREKIIYCLGYSKRRSDFYPKYFQKLGIKSCVYCNALLTITVDRDDISTPNRAKFQVDHFLYKNGHPYLSATLFNLYPVCANCNNIKGEKKVFFNLYEETPAESSEFLFELKPGVVAAYMLYRKSELIDFTLKQPAVPIGYEDHDVLFDVSNIYLTQKDVVEELILKMECYPPSFRETLKNSFPEIFKDDLLLDRVIVGNYTLDRDMHKRPFSKFTRDMAIALGLLKE